MEQEVYNKEQVFMTWETFNKIFNSVVTGFAKFGIACFTSYGIFTFATSTIRVSTDHYETKALSYEERAVSYALDENRSYQNIKEGFAAMDINRDGHIDFLRQDRFGNVFAYINDGTGVCKNQNISHFKVPLGFDFTMADVDGDGLEDLLLFRDDSFYGYQFGDRMSDVYMYRNLGDFTFDLEGSQ